MEFSEKRCIFISNLFQLYESMAEDLHNLLHDKLKEYFGFTSFKGYQEAVITNVLEGKDTFAPRCRVRD